MVQLSLGYPSDDDEERIVHQHGRDDSWSGFAPVVAQERLNQWQGLVDSITIHDEVVSYLVTLVRRRAAIRPSRPAPARAPGSRCRGWRARWRWCAATTGCRWT